MLKAGSEGPGPPERVAGPPPSPEMARALWQRLVDHDPIAPSDLAVAYLDHLSEWLIRHNPRVDPQDCTTAAGNAIISLIKNPTAYHPERQNLTVYLRLSARGDLRNLLRTERRHRERQVDWEKVELSPGLGKYLQDEGADPATMVEQQEAAAEARQRLADTLQRAVHELSPEEVDVLRLMLSGERRTAVFARALGLTDRSEAEQQREVKRVKDRVRKWLRRLGVIHD